jgi:hypothetical protein
MGATFVQTARTAVDFVVKNLANNFIQIWAWFGDSKTMPKWSKKPQIKIRRAEKCNYSKAMKSELIDSWDDEKSIDMQIRCTDAKSN